MLIKQKLLTNTTLQCLTLASNFAFLGPNNNPVSKKLHLLHKQHSNNMFLIKEIIEADSKKIIMALILKMITLMEIQQNFILLIILQSLLPLTHHLL